ncbi:MAG: hypothetical protein IT202_03250, partial [Fimbriimonadaceae bacterium]|nr:hypothetical protein [Fimbriimonadaceae bacterium]
MVQLQSGPDLKENRAGAPRAGPADQSYSNRTRGWRKKRGLLSADPPAKDPAADSDKAPLDQRRAWARLIQKVYEVNPLLCPRCGSEMKVVAVIDD